MAAEPADARISPERLGVHIRFLPSRGSDSDTLHRADSDELRGLTTILLAAATAPPTPGPGRFLHATRSGLRRSRSIRSRQSTSGSRICDRAATADEEHRKHEDYPRRRSMTGLIAVAAIVVSQSRSAGSTLQSRRQEEHGPVASGAASPTTSALPTATTRRPRSPIDTASMPR